MRKTCLLFLGCLLAAIAHGEKYYVSPTGGGDGSTAESPCKLSDLILKNKSPGIPEGSFIQLLDGVYTETPVSNELYELKAVKDIVIEGNVSDPSRVVFDGQGDSLRFFGLNSKAGLTIRGVTFKDTNSGNYYQAFYVSDSLLNVEDCIFSNITNTVANGAAIYLADSNSTGTVRRCTFVDCASPNGSGGAIARNNDTGIVRLYDCEFSNCSAKNAGAAQGVSVVADCRFTNCTVKDSNGGGAIWQNIADAEIRGSDFINCSSGNKNGGALYLTKPAKLADCTFTGCTAANSGGAAIYASGEAQGLSLTNCVFTTCSTTANNGGALNFSGAASLMDCVFNDCTAPTHGGAILTSAAINLARCQFSGCRAQYGGAVGLTGSGTAEFSACSFTSNTCTQQGSAICLNAAGTLLVSDCTFKGNSISASGTIAYRSANNATIKIDRSTFINNSAARGAGMFCDVTAKEILVRNCLFAGCVTSTGNGGMALELKGTCTVDNCTFANCLATGASNDYLCPLELNGGTLTARNCIFWDNLKKTVNPPQKRSVYIRSGSGTLSNSVYDGMRSGNTPVISDCTVLSACPFVADGSWDEGSTAFTPGDYTLLTRVEGEKSPCVESGVKLDWMTPDSVDLAGNPRLRGPDYGIVDLGCYELLEKSGLLIIVK